MAYHQRGRGGRGKRYPPGNDRAQQMFQRCVNLRINYPPDPVEVWEKMLVHKNIGEVCLNQGQLQRALENYSFGLELAGLFPTESNFQEEAAKILCNRSLVLLRMEIHNDAERDAAIAIQTRPTFIKGYWRAYQAVKDGKAGPGGPIVALTYLADGLRQAVHGHGTKLDIITFLTELCTIVQNIPNSPMTDSILQTIDVPDISEREIWTKTLQRLAGSKRWECVCMLVTGERGPDCILNEMCSDEDFSVLDIDGLFDLSVKDLKEWGISLACVMIERGASLDNIEDTFKKPVLHVAVDLAIRTDSVEVLESILKRTESTNSQNQDGQTALHLAVLSGKVLQPIGEKIVGVLLRHQCDSNIRDKKGKQPIDYVVEGTNVFAKLKKATKSVEELRQELEALKQKGNEALKGGNNGDALKFYERALEISKRSQELYKEAAVVYSNTANVYFSMKDWDNALVNSLAAVSCNNAYHKGHWWKGKVLCQMGAIQDAFTAYIDGFTYSDTASDLKLNFLIEAVTQLKYLREDELTASYNQLRFIDQKAWPLTLQKLSTNVEWKCIAYLIFGPKLDQRFFNASPTDDILDRLCAGVAGNCSKESMDLKTVFSYLQSPYFSSADVLWLDIALVTIYRHGNKTVLNTLAVDSTDTPLHAVTRFSLLTRRTNTLEEVLKEPLATLRGQFINGRGDSVYHTITKMYPLPEEKTLFRVTECFLNKGFHAMVPDKSGKLPVHYLSKSCNSYVFDLFAAFSWDDVTHLKELGNRKIKSGDIVDAIELYTQAIEMVQTQGQGQWRAEYSKEIAILYSNRAEGYLKLSDYDSALEDGRMSVSYNGYWYKGHMRVAKALKGMKKMVDSLRAFINAYKDISVTEEKVQIEILLELVLVCKHLSPDEIRGNLRDFPPNQGHVWIKTSYELIRKDDWVGGKIAYNQYDKAKRKVSNIVFSLSPMCKLDQMRANPWVVNMIRVFLKGGANKMTLTLSKGDTYIHAAVRISLLIVKNGSFLDWLLKRYKESHRVDRDGNTPLHTATREKDVVPDIRYDIVMILLRADVDPTHKNQRGEQAIDLLPRNDTKTSEYLRMAMYRVENVPQMRSNSTYRQEPKRKAQEITQPQQPKQILRKTCEECVKLLESGKQCFQDDQISDGHANLTEILKMNHKGKKHEEMINQALAAIVETLGEKAIPEIPSCLTSISKDFYLRVIDGLILKKKWQQLHSVVRKYRSLKGSDKLKGFASGLSVVPVIEDPVFKDKEEIQMQIIANMLSSGASMGTDCGQKALESAKTVQHFKVVADLIKKGADTSHFSMKSGDTPIHAIVSLVLEKEKKEFELIKFVFDQFEDDPEIYTHLNPCQQNRAGDSLFHLVAKTKCTNTVLKVTEFLCKRNVSAAYYNKEKKLPSQYITKKNDRRLQYFRLAANVSPVGQQKYRENSAAEDQQEESSDDEMQRAPRVDEVESLGSSIVEKVHPESERDQRKRKIEELIRLLPDVKLGGLENNSGKDSDLGLSKGEDLTNDKADEIKQEKDVAIMPEKLVKQRKDSETQLEKGGTTKRYGKEKIEDQFVEGSNTDKVVKRAMAAQGENSKKVPNDKEKLENRSKKLVSEHVARNTPEINNIGRESETDTTAQNTDLQEKIYVGSKTVVDIVPDETVIYDRKQSVRKNLSVDECHDNTGRKISSEEIGGADQTLVNTSKMENGEKKDGGESDKITISESDFENQNNLDKSEETNHDGPCQFTHAEIVNETEANGADPDKGQKEEVEEEDSESDDYDEEEEEIGDDEEFDPEKFDKLEWEVECTADVWKTLRDKHVLPELKNRIVKKVQLLASGDWQPVLCKKLKNVPKTLDLFEAKFSKGSRIIWEKAIAFSPRCSEVSERRLELDSEDRNQPVRGGRIYSEIIRVWDIVFDHKKIHKSVENIKKSHQRGEECIIQKKLRGQKTDVSQLTLYQGCRIYPKKFSENDIPVEQEEEMQQFFPPASSNETEYHILKFYTFSSTLVSHVMQNIDAKVDFPFKVTDLEHAIINLVSKAPTLLLGRSGTGKTTCCVYRLWSKFHGYWTMAREADAPLLPRACEFVKTEVPGDGNQEDDADSQDEDMTDVEDTIRLSQMADAEQNDQMTPECDHLHQLFITKNLVLCSEVQKNFRELSHADGLMREHVQHEEDELPNKLQDVGDFSYPLFLTSRQLLMMLDASVGQPYFFDRKDDGSLKADVEGWSDDGPLSVLPLLDEDSDSEDEEGNQYQENDEEEYDVEVLQTTTRKKKVDPRREITYQMFVEEVWPKIKKKMSYHPSLVWTEIVSFIKGSYEALSRPEGFLALDDYQNLGKKRAPNFSAERQPIHKFFKGYEHFKKQHHLFDETDLVHNIYRRLGRLGNRPWVIHEVYVDETQDFTQAELCLLIQICQNPNHMFLTGDTAQSIMRGISFRFSDLKSLFYHAKQSMHAMGKTSAIAVPKKVYQLTHNYRSHAGILSLASSVLELMVEFFPESFDRLQRDQGLFTGPQPILLESCSFGDLAVLLRGNKRRTSHIEFGAHQAILVVNEAARDTIPEELRLGLVLTIYEAKGLEFDDVLLYNFFKDSQAMKEWGVVTQYLEDLLLSQKEHAEKEGLQDSLVEIDEDILKQPSRPRPLTFDPNVHKVLNSELKHLYTALTRARVNVWIFDEDMEKRAPMFEYFKARRLVKSLTVLEINEESLAETVFAEKSSKEEWIRRGDDFMRHSLYNVAAKCFGMAGDLEREKLALAHVQALKASRLKDNPREMRREFLKAAEMYLNCSKPAKAAICLQNAKELELAAELFEKLSQYERAGDIYRKLKLSIASSRCYEQLGYFNKAVDVLYENENYEMAIDTLRRYQMRVKDYIQNDAIIPGNLHSNRPAAHHTEEKLSHRAAVKFYRIGNTERMLSAIESFPKMSDRVDFLEKRGFVTEAARILESNGEYRIATNLLLMHGLVSQATGIARTQPDQALIGHCILVSCRVVMAKRKEDSDFPTEIPEFQKKDLLTSMAEGIEMFEACKINDEFGELRLLQAELSMNVTLVKEAWKAFKDSKPVQNEVGLIECSDWLVRHSRLHELDVLRQVVTAIGYTFTACYTLSRPNDIMNMDKVTKYMQLYGLNHYSQNEVVVHPKERPICLPILIGNINAEKYSTYILNREDSYATIIKFLLQRAKQWISTIWEILSQMRNKNKVCDRFQASLECPNQTTEENKCIHIHGPLKIENLRTLIQIDLLMIELEGDIQAGASRLRSVCPLTVKELVLSFIEEAERDNSEKFKACTNLLDDLMPFSGHPSLIADDSDELVKYLRKSNKVLGHMRDFLREQWKIKRGQGKAYKCLAAKETEIFLLLEFGYRLFGLDVRCILDPSPIKCLRNLEFDIDSEVARGEWVIKGLKHYTLATYLWQGKTYVDCIAKRFFAAYSFMSSKPDPYEAVFRFSKFVILQRFRVYVTQLPELHHYAMWLEFYLTVGIILVAKLKTKDLSDFVFILPSNFLALVKFIEATFPNPKVAQVITGIDYFTPPPKHYQNATSRLQDRLKYICFGVTGFDHNLNILQEALKLGLGNPHFYAVAERIVILQMVLVLNIGKAMPVECEKSLMKVLSNIQLPADSPYRLQDLATYIQHNVKGISDLALGLMSLLKSRQQGEELLVCEWNPKSKQKLKTTKLESEKLFITTFFNSGTLDAMHNKDTVVDDIQEDAMIEEDLTEEETEQRIQVKQQQEENERKDKAAIKITNFFKRIRAIKKAKQCIDERKIELVYGEFKQFDSVKVTDKYCGYCGVNLRLKVSEALKYEQSRLVGGQSVMNINTGHKQFERSDSVRFVPTSPDKGPDVPLAWGNMTKNDNSGGANFHESSLHTGVTGQQSYQPFDSRVTYQQNNSNDVGLSHPEGGYIYQDYNEQSTSMSTGHQGDQSTGVNMGHQGDQSTVVNMGHQGNQSVVVNMGPRGDQSGHFTLQRSVSHDGQKSQELRKKIKGDHLQDEQHLRKKLEYEIFEKKCRSKIIPKLDTIREFLDNEDYQLKDREYAEKHYADRHMEIERLQTNLPKIDSEILKIFQTREWSSTGKIDQLLVELGGDFDNVRAYVEHVFTKLKEKEEQRKLAASKPYAGSHHYYGRFEEGVEEEFEEVVDDPRTRKKSKVYRRSRNRGKNKK